VVVDEDVSLATDGPEKEMAAKSAKKNALQINQPSRQSMARELQVCADILSAKIIRPKASRGWRRF
jgi:hypothetical protein